MSTLQACTQRVGQLARYRQRFGDRNRSGREAIRQRRSRDQLEHEREAWPAILDAVDGGDVRVIERREELRLSLETRQPA